MRPPPIQGAFRTDLRARAAYAEGAGIYRILPAAVCLPADVDDLVHLTRWAAAEGVALIPRGAGSAMGGGNVGTGVIVDLTRLRDRQLTVSPERRIARAGAQMTLAGLNAAAAPHGLRLPPDPSSGRWATLGGMLSTNAAGARTVRYGSVRPWVRSLEMVTSDGEHVRLERGTAPGPAAALARLERDVHPAVLAAAATVAARFPRTRKNSSGYALDAWLESGDALDLVVGGEGTLGFVTAAEWRLDAVPGSTAALRISLPTLDALADVVAELLSHSPSAVELLDRTFLDLVGRADGAEAVLLVEIEGPDAGAAESLARAAGAAVAPHALRVETALSDAAVQRLWSIRHAASPILASLPEDRRSLQVIEDGCVPVARLGEYVRAVRGAAAARGLDVVLFGHAGDGHLHANLLPELARPGWERAVASLLEDVTDAVIRLGGTVSGEHGDGRLRAPSAARRFGDEIVALFAAVKTAFDPHGIFNPGVILGSAPPIAGLKAGSGAAALPPDIAAALRGIEQRGGYDRLRLELADAASRD